MPYAKNVVKLNLGFIYVSRRRENDESPPGRGFGAELRD